MPQHIRSRLSLDLSSPTSELPTTHQSPTNTSILSPRYSEFNLYNGHHHKQHENNNGIDIIGNSNDHINGTSNVTNNNMSMPPQMRSSLLNSHSGEYLLFHDCCYSYKFDFYNKCVI